MENKVAEALEPELEAFHTIDSQVLLSVWRIDSEGSVDGLIFCFNSVNLVINAEIRDDTVSFWSDEDAEDPHDAINLGGGVPWKGLIGKPFGRGWVTVNQQGKCDGLMLSFGCNTPQVLLNVAESMLNIHVIESSLERD